MTNYSTTTIQISGLGCKGSLVQIQSRRPNYPSKIIHIERAPKVRCSALRFIQCPSVSFSFIECRGNAGEVSYRDLFTSVSESEPISEAVSFTPSVKQINSTLQRFTTSNQQQGETNEGHLHCEARRIDRGTRRQAQYLAGNNGSGPVYPSEGLAQLGYRDRQWHRRGKNNERRYFSSGLKKSSLPLMVGEVMEAHGVGYQPSPCAFVFPLELAVKSGRGARDNGSNQFRKQNL